MHLHSITKLGCYTLDVQEVQRQEKIQELLSVSKALFALFPEVLYITTNY